MARFPLFSEWVLMKKFWIFFAFFIHQVSSVISLICMYNIIIVLIRRYIYIIWHMFYILWNIFGKLIGYSNTYCKNPFDIGPSIFSPLIIETNFSQLSYEAVSKNWFSKKEKSNRRKIKLHRGRIIGKRKEIINSENNSEWKIVKKGGDRKTKAKRYQRELMKMAGYRGTNEITGALGCAATRLARNVDEVKRSQGNWRTFQM